MAAGIWLVLATIAVGATPKLPVVPKWHRFEHAFKSSLVYTNPLQEVTFSVVFTSPLGEKSEVFGFWDGGRTWRVRFAPDQPGEWQYQSRCSAPDSGLANQTGAFLCTAALGPSRFEQHGPVRAARDHCHLEHADGTPFFWLADTAWNGARVSLPREWDYYAQVRARQGFTAVRWVAGPGEDFRNDSGLTGFPDQIQLNPEVFRQLDAKVETLSRAGILSAIVPYFETRTNVAPLHEDQATLLVRYIVARWGAEPVMWLLPGNSEATGESAEQWTHIGRAVFKSGPHRPVVMLVQGDVSALRPFTDETWAEIFGCNIPAEGSADLLRRSFSLVSALWTNDAARPVLAATPAENEIIPGTQKRFSADAVRHAAYWGLLLGPPAGVSYSAHGVVDWDGTTDNVPGAELPLWHRALFMPAAKQISYLQKLFTGMDFGRLRPQLSAIANQAGEADPSRQIVAAGTEAKDLLVVYVPQERTVEINLEAMPGSPTVNWFNPRTGETSPAVAVVGGHSCQFPTPEPGDWVLVMRAGK